MKSPLALVLPLLALAGCSVEMPEFLGRTGSGEAVYTLRGDPVPEPVPVPLASARVERFNFGVIVRVEGIAPSQGYWGAALQIATEAEASGIMPMAFTAIPPEQVEAIGPPQTRVLTAAAFVPNRAMKGVRGFQVTGAGSGETLTLR